MGTDVAEHPKDGTPLGPADEVSVWRFAGAELDEGTRELRVDGELADIEPRPFDLLLMLLRRAGEVVTTEEIIATTWAGRIFNESSVVNVSNAVSKLRRVLRDDQREIIRTIPKYGYRLIAPVERIPRPRSLTASFEVGTSIPGRPNWRLMEHLETGGYGDVWLGTHLKTQERRVFKFCDDETRLSALKREATLFRILRETLGERAPVPSLLEWQFERPPYYLEAERWGQDLRAWSLSRGGLAAVPLESRLAVLAQTAEIVTTIHSVGVLHKDLKPQNILVREDGVRLDVRLCDLGAGVLIEHPRHENLTITRAGFTHTVGSMGTPMYAAPELLSGSAASVQSEVYALGVLFYQLVVGDFRPVAFGWETDIADDILRADIAGCLDRDPAKRPSSALLISEMLRSLPDRREQRRLEKEAELHSKALAESIARARARRPWMLAATIMLLLAVGISSGLMISARKAARRATDNERIARSVADFLTNDLVRRSSPDYGGHVDITLKKAVLDAVPKISQRLNGNEIVAAELSLSLAEYLASVSDLPSAARLAHQAGAYYGQVLGSNDRRTINARLDEIGYLVYTETPRTLEPMYVELGSQLENIPKDDPLRLKEAIVHSWIISHVRGDLEHNDAPLLAALETFRGKNGQEVDKVWLAHLRALNLAGHDQELLRISTDLLPHFEQRYGTNGHLTLELRRQLGRAFLSTREPSHQTDLAMAQFKVVLEGATSVYGEDSKEVDLVMMDIGDTYELQERWSDWEILERNLLLQFDKHFGPNSFYTWRTRAVLLASLFHKELNNAEASSSAVSDATSIIQLARSDLPDGFLRRQLELIGALVLITANQMREGKELLDEVASLDASAPASGISAKNQNQMLAYGRGLIAQAQGDKTLAIAQYERALDSVPPGSWEARDAQVRLSKLRKDLLTSSSSPPLSSFASPPSAHSSTHPA